MAELLVRHGANIHRRRADGRTAYTLAKMQGNLRVAEWLQTQGAIDELDPLEQFISACASGDGVAAKAMLQSSPELRGELAQDHHRMLHVPAERGDAAVVDTMIACGFDPHVKDQDGVTALHKAAMAGHADAVRVLLTHGASPNALDSMFLGSPLVWAAEGWKRGASGRADHLEVARLLSAFGASLEWTPPPNAPDPELGQEQLSELCRAALAESPSASYVTKTLKSE
jgi:ankyrin repeat protein